MPKGKAWIGFISEDLTSTGTQILVTVGVNENLLLPTALITDPHTHIYTSHTHITHTPYTHTQTHTHHKGALRQEEFLLLR